METKETNKAKSHITDMADWTRSTGISASRYCTSASIASPRDVEKDFPLTCLEA